MDGTLFLNSLLLFNRLFDFRCRVKTNVPDTKASS